MVKVKCKEILPAIFHDERIAVIKMACGYEQRVLVRREETDEDNLTVLANFLRVDKTRFDTVRVRIEGIEDDYEFNIRKEQLIT